MMNRNKSENKKETRTTITLTGFHKRYADAFIPNLSQFVRNCITKEMVTEFGELRNLDVIRSLLHTHRFGSIVILIASNANFKQIINEFVEDVKKIMRNTIQNECSYIITTRYDEKIEYRLSNNIIEYISENQLIQSDDAKCAQELITYSYAFRDLIKALPESEEKLRDALEYIIAIVFIDDD